MPGVDTETEILTNMFRFARPSDAVVRTQPAWVAIKRLSLHRHSVGRLGRVQWGESWPCDHKNEERRGRTNPLDNARCHCMCLRGRNLR